MRKCSLYQARPQTGLISLAEQRLRLPDFYCFGIAVREGLIMRSPAEALETPVGLRDR